MSADGSSICSRFTQTVINVSQTASLLEKRNKSKLSWLTITEIVVMYKVLGLKPTFFYLNSHKPSSAPSEEDLEKKLKTSCSKAIEFCLVSWHDSWVDRVKLGCVGQEPNQEQMLAKTVPEPLMTPHLHALKPKEFCFAARRSSGDGICSCGPDASRCCLFAQVLLSCFRVTFFLLKRRLNFPHLAKCSPKFQALKIQHSNSFALFFCSTHPDPSAPPPYQDSWKW